MKILHLVNIQVTAENTPFSFSPSFPPAPRPDHACLTFGCKCWGQVGTRRRPTRGGVQCREFKVPPSLSFSPAASSSQVEVCQGVLPYKPCSSTAPCNPRHVPVSPSRAQGTRTAAELCRHRWPSDPFSHGKGSTILATAQVFPKQLSQERARDCWHPQRCPWTRSPSTPPGKSQGAKMRGAKCLHGHEQQASKHSSLPKRRVGPLPVKFPRTNSNYPCTFWCLWAHLSHKLPPGASRSPVVREISQHFIEAGWYRSDENAKWGNTQRANLSFKNNQPRACFQVLVANIGVLF